MITFLTLFLGLFSGPHSIELAVEPPVERVELILDGVPVGAAAGPPFRFEVDFGDEIAPHRLIAIGRDGAGAEVTRASRDVNLVPREAGLAVALEPAAGGGPGAALLGWHSVERSAPERLTLWLDGEPLVQAAGPVGVPERVPLPQLDPREIHFLTAELRFESGAVARAERVFGGEFSREIDTDNTAVAVEVTGRRRLRRPKDAAGLVRVGAGAARVLAVEHGPADLVIVRERGAFEELASLAARMLPAHFAARSFGGRAADRFFLIAPAPRLLPVRGGARAVFPASPALPGARGNLLYWLAGQPYDPQEGSPQEIPAAVAMAGMVASSAARPRTVLLVIGPEAAAMAPADPARVRRYLERLQVPLAVWYVQSGPLALPPRERALERERGEAAAAARGPAHLGREALLAATRRSWGETVEDIGTVAALVDAARELRRRVARQRILWIDGDHLPTEVTVVSDAQVRPAGQGG